MFFVALTVQYFCMWSIRMSARSIWKTRTAGKNPTSNCRMDTKIQVTKTPGPKTRKVSNRFKESRSQALRFSDERPANRTSHSRRKTQMSLSSSRLTSLN